MREEMTVSKVSRQDRGSCSFCHDEKHRTVYEVRAPQPGGLMVRFCSKCLEKLPKLAKKA